MINGSFGMAQKWDIQLYRGLLVGLSYEVGRAFEPTFRNRTKVIGPHAPFWY